MPELAEREEPPEPADVAHHLGSERGPNVLLDELDRLLAGRDVDAGLPVGESVVVLVSSTHRGTPTVRSGTGATSRTTPRRRR